MGRALSRFPVAVRHKAATLGARRSRLQKGCGENRTPLRTYWRMRQGVLPSRDREDPGILLEQPQQLLLSQGEQGRRVLLDQLRSQGALSVLEGEDPLPDAVLCDESVNEHGFLLADAVAALHGLAGDAYR